MGARGPLPVPHARRRNKREAIGNKVIVKRPTMPRNLEGEARAEWRRVVPDIEAMGLLASVDRGVLIRYCVAWADWCELNETLQRTGKLVKGARGQLVRNPLWIMRADIDATLSDLGRQLGLSPNARIRVGVAHEPPEEPVDERPISLEERRRALQG